MVSVGCPDPYVTVQVPGTPNGLKKTSHVKDCSNPHWNQDFEFYVDVAKDKVLEFVLFDLNRTVNEELGKELYDFSNTKESTLHNVEISFKNVSSDFLYVLYGY